MTEIKKIAVIGAGVMGSGIAAQCANAGYDVVLLDIVPKDAEDRNIIAAAAIKKMLKADPAPLMSKRFAKRITPGNIDDNMDMISDCDWIIEVVLERLDIKHATFEKIEAHRKKGSIVTSNTSTIPLSKLTEGQPESFKKDFMISHFFNPPRYMRLLELVVGPETNPDAAETIRAFCDEKLGKGVVLCKDTPGFIVNRLLVFWMQAALNQVVEDKVPLEVADLVMGKPIGVPKTAVFGLIDLVGVDLMPYLSSSMLGNLPQDDEYRKIHKDFPFVQQMIEAGYNGRKGKGGFYRLNPDAPKGTREKQTLQLDPENFDESQYIKSNKPRLESVKAGKKGLKAVVTTEDAGGDYAWKVLSKTLAYAASLVPQIADNIAAVDEAMRLGTNWKKGPFEMIDQLGPKWFAEKLAAEGIEVPELLTKVGDGTFYKVENEKLSYFGTDGQYHPVERGEGVILLRDIKLSSEPVIKNSSASAWDIGDGVLCFEFTGKMNALDDQVMDLYLKTIKLIEKDAQYKALVIYNEGSHFSAGANLGLAMFALNIALYPQIEQMVSMGQKAYSALKYANFPVVGAPSGMALGGGCEILLHCDHVQAHAETYVGLVEVGVGLIPGWGGCTIMMQRLNNDPKLPKGPMAGTRKAFETIAVATVAKSAFEAKDHRYFRESDGITMNRDRLLFDAKQKALELVDDYQAPEEQDILVAGAGGKMALDMAVADLRKSGKATPHDVVVSEALAKVLTGGDNGDPTTPISEKDMLKLEAVEFMKLTRTDDTLDRIEHMLTTGKPLRN